MPLMCGHLDRAIHITVDTSWRGIEALEYPCRLHILDQGSLLNQTFTHHQPECSFLMHAKWWWQR